MPIILTEEKGERGREGARCEREEEGGGKEDLYMCAQMHTQVMEGMGKKRGMRAHGEEKEGGGE